MVETKYIGFDISVCLNLRFLGVPCTKCVHVHTCMRSHLSIYTISLKLVKMLCYTKSCQENLISIHINPI